MLEKIKNYAIAVLGLVTAVLLGLFYRQRAKTDALETTVATDKAKENLTTAITKENESEQVAKSADDSFEHLATDWEKRHPPGKG